LREGKILTRLWAIIRKELTQMQAIQMMVFILLPSIILSGFMFPRESMPRLLYNMGYLIPPTYFLNILYFQRPPLPEKAGMIGK